MTLNYFSKHRSVIIYSASLAALLFLLKWLEWRFLIVNYAVEMYAGLIAIVFTALGIWIAMKLSEPKTIVASTKKKFTVSSNDFVLDQNALCETGISKRELDVLVLIAQGLSNQEIAGHLFVSLNTIKTHSSKLFEKLEVQRRTQAVEKARRLCLIP